MLPATIPGNRTRPPQPVTCGAGRFLRVRWQASRCSPRRTRTHNGKARGKTSDRFGTATIKFFSKLLVEEVKGLVDGMVLFDAVGPWALGCTDHCEAERRARVLGSIYNQVLWTGIKGSKPYPETRNEADLNKNRRKLPGVMTHSFR